MGQRGEILHPGVRTAQLEVSRDGSVACGLTGSFGITWHNSREHLQ